MTIRQLPPAENVLRALFRVPKPIIGTVHLMPLPGAPQYGGGGIGHVLARAVRDARACTDNGIDGLVIENEGDIPFRKPDKVGPDTVAALTAVAAAVKAEVEVPIGINCLANAVTQSLAVAVAVDGLFVRANQWANAYIANEGLVEGAAAEALRFRSSVRGEHIRVLADVHVKHGSHAIVGDRSVEEQARDVEAFGADALIATGSRTGDSTRVREVVEIKEGTGKPVLVGSGMTRDNARELLQVADGAIVGSALKHGGVWWNPVDETRVAKLMQEVERVRQDG